MRVSSSNHDDNNGGRLDLVLKMKPKRAPFFRKIVLWHKLHEVWCKICSHPWFIPILRNIEVGLMLWDAETSVLYIVCKLYICIICLGRSYTSTYIGIWKYFNIANLFQWCEIEKWERERWKRVKVENWCLILDSIVVYLPYI